MNSQLACCAFTIAIALSVSHATAADTLIDKLKDAGWDGIIGTWVDPATQNTTTFAWKIKDRVIEVTGKQKSKHTVALVGVNAKTGDVFHVGADSDGTSVLGKWELEDDDAVLGLLFTSGDGQEGALKIRYHREGADTMTVSIELPGVAEPIGKGKLIRANRSSK